MAESEDLVVEMSRVTDSWTQLTDNSEELQSELEIIAQHMDKLAATNLPSLTLEGLQHDLNQCKQVRHTLHSQHLGIYYE